jgi:hypothetical protein
VARLGATALTDDDSLSVIHGTRLTALANAVGYSAVPTSLFPDPVAEHEQESFPNTACVRQWK